VIGEYISSQVASGSGQKSLIGHLGRRAHSEPIMNSVSIFSESQTPATLVRMGAPLSIAVEFLRKTNPLRPVLGLVVKTAQGWPVVGINNRFVGGYQFEEPLKQGTITCTIDSLPLTPGTYVLDLYLGDYYQDFDTVLEAITFEVVPSDVFGTGRLPPPGVGVIYVPAAWTLSDHCAL
jgi:lipopolysaccharide transport system ATP-binding protein